MNIVFVSTLFPPRFYGGAEILTMLVAQGLSRLGHKVTVYTGGREKMRHKQGVIIKQIPELAMLNIFRTAFSPVYAYVLHKKLGKEADIRNADIIHATDVNTITLLSSWIRIRDKFVVTIQDYDMLCANGSLLVGDAVCPLYCRKKKSFVCLKKDRFKTVRFLNTATYSVRKHIRDTSLSSLRNIVCVSNFVKKQIIHEVDEHTHISVIRNCVQDEWIESVKKEKKDIDILYVGKLTSYKGFHVFLRAVQIVQKRKKIKVFCIGEGNINYYQKTIKKLKLKKNTVIFTHGIPYANIASYYQRAKIVVSPSVWPEPCGRTIMEAMVFGVPVVATRVGGTPESVVDKKHGFLVTVNDAHAIATACIHLLDNNILRHKLGQQARVDAKALYSCKKISKEYEKHYSLMRSD